MTSFSDEQPLSRRARRERLREQQVQNDVLGSAPADADDAAPGNDASSNDDRVASDAESTATSGAELPTGGADADETSAGESERQLTRRERRAKMLRDAETASQPVAAQPREEEPAETDDSAMSPEPAAPTPVPAAPKGPSTKPARAEKTTSAAPSTQAAKATKAAGPEQLRPAAVVDAEERTLADVIAAQRDDDAPRLSPAFGAGIRVERERESAPPSFDRVIAPQARSSDALTTSSVLILPTGPQHEFPGPVRTTGEILVTGSVDLPTSGAENETHSGVDRTDIDSGIDQNGNVPATAGTPVSATKAVSTHTSTRDVITPPTKSANSRLLMILAVTAGVLCVAVIGVVIVGLMTGAL